MIAFLILFVTLGRMYRDMARKPETRALLILSGLVLAIGVLFYIRVEGWSLIDSIYFCVVTLGTVGYGDITPTTDVGKIFTIIYILVGLSIIGGFFATLGQLVTARERSSIRSIKNEIEHPLKGESKDAE